jgi:hypothetical protein
VVAIASGQPALQLQGKRAGRVRYRLRPGVSSGGAGESAWPPQPPAAAARADELAALPISTRAVAAAEFVRRRVAYDTSAETVAKHRDARRRSIGLFARAAAIGAGDCDVQNSLVAAMLAEAGVRSRLAVGWVGFGGRARTGLHAWTEYRDEGGSWQVIDASVGAADGPSAADAIPVPEEPPDRQRTGFLAWVALALSALLALAAVAILCGRRSWRRSFRAGGEDDVVGLLRGAAIRPHAFEEIHSLVTRRLLRLLGGRPISLARARQAARRGHLACGSRRSRLARRAARGGGLVLDLDRAESAAVADVLTAIDLDRWQALLEGSVRNELTVRVEEVLRACREPGRLVLADNPGYELEILDGHGLGLGKGDRWAVADVNGALWISAGRLAARRPDRAVLLLVDAVLHRTGAPPSVRRRCLSGPALESLREASREAL